MTTTQNPPTPYSDIQIGDIVTFGSCASEWVVVEHPDNGVGELMLHCIKGHAQAVRDLLVTEGHTDLYLVEPRTTTQNPATPLTVPARELRKGDVISMGTIESATPVVQGGGRSYVSIRFETRIGIHGTAFPLDLEVTVISRTSSGDDPALDFTSPLVLSARGLKPGMAVIQNDTRTVRVVQAVSPGLPGQDTVISYQGAPDVSVPGGEPMLVTRLSAMAVYHARQEQRETVTALTETVELWTKTAVYAADQAVSANNDGAYQRSFELKIQAGQLERCAAEVRDILDRLRPDQPVSFDTYCAWCQKDWTEHVGGKPGVPGGPSTCPSSSVD